MSLTGLLGAKGSLLRATFQELLPGTSRFVESVNHELVAFPPNTERPADPGLSGTALDYRIHAQAAAEQLRPTYSVSRPRARTCTAEALSLPSTRYCTLPTAVHTRMGRRVL